MAYNLQQLQRPIKGQLDNMNNRFLGCMIVSLLLTTTGTFTNTISMSFFVRRKYRNLGDKFLVYLNTIDLTICVFLLLSTTLSFFGSIPGNYDILYFSTYELFIELAGLITCLLCALRAISICMPLYQINKRKVYVCSSVIAAYVVGTKLYALIASYVGDGTLSDTNGKFANSTYISAFVNAGLMLICPLIFSIISIRALKKQRPERAGGDGPGTNSNEKATEMILILAAMFLTFNSAWMIMMLYFFLADKNNKDRSINEVGMLSFVIVSTNSALNPIVYMTRNMEMNTYVKKLYNQFTNVVCRSSTTNSRQVGALDERQN